MREETQRTSVWIFCKLPITPEQRPSVQVGDGRDVHRECWDEYQDGEHRRL